MKKFRIKKIPKPILISFISKMAFLLFSVLIFFTLTYYIPRNTEYEYTENTQSSKKSVISFTEREPIHKVVLENDKLVIYRSDGSVSVANGIDTDMLTEYDIRLFSEGIAVTEDELYELIESMMS